MLLPRSRGPLSAGLFERLREGVVPFGHADAEDAAGAASAVRASGVIEDDDAQISLWVLYELHYRSFDDVAQECEWAPDILDIRRRIEAPFEDAIRAETAEEVDAVLGGAGSLTDRLFAMAESFEAPALAEYVQRRATREQIREFLLLRSVYHLKEADPHSWVIPRLTGAAKAGLVELQFDEYGDGRADRVHQDLFAETLRRVHLDDRYGAYVSDAPAATLAVSNAMSLFGLHRRLRAAAMGHLGAFEATSSVPCRRYAAGIRRVGFDDEAARYFDEHVEADAVHEQLAIRGVCVSLVAAEPALEADVVLGAVTCLMLDARAAS
jgi:hypothetical protein